MLMNAILRCCFPCQCFFFWVRTPKKPNWTIENGSLWSSSGFRHFVEPNQWSGSWFSSRTLQTRPNWTMAALLTIPHEFKPFLREGDCAITATDAYSLAYNGQLVFTSPNMSFIPKLYNNPSNIMQARVWDYIASRVFFTVLYILYTTCIYTITSLIESNWSTLLFDPKGFLDQAQGSEERKCHEKLLRTQTHTGTGEKVTFLCKNCLCKPSQESVPTPHNEHKYFAFDPKGEASAAKV
ncbi:uncharacterized protein F5147DRAFT_652024 [Suillus discolor]|uniref:Uncharacterized protein n=1 Tax=Suillus discolor TaxID=1912936 RepID=A0A9P7JV91_9AGAM|nr:uncharacterized protein F5147DRAFT_652024 [Suillus discolor]KAG2109830.1 hypothetical protein F5147DRAFT_652024 [Suillus discolor]